MATRAVAADERIGIAIETSYEGSGVRAARTDTGALATAAREVASAQQQVTISTEQSDRMWQKAGGDFAKFNALVREHVALQKQLIATQQQSAAGSGRTAADIIPRLNQEVDRIPAKARTAANAVSLLAFAALQGGGGLRGMAVAAGTAADGIAVLSGSARIAASAAGIGAVITVLSTVLLLLNQTEEKAKNLGGTFRLGLGDLSDEALGARQQLLASRAAQQRDIAGRLDDIAKSSFNPLTANVASAAAKQALKDAEALDKELSTIFDEQINRRRNKGRDISREIQQQEEADRKRSSAMLEQLAKSYQEMYDKRTQSAEGAGRLKAENEFADHLKEIGALHIREEEKTTLIAAAAKERSERILNIHRDAAARQNEIDEKLFREQQERYDRSLAEVTSFMRQELDAAITGRESYISAVTKMFLTPIVRKLEAKAIDQTIDGGAELIFGNFIGAARHFALAAAAVAAAQRVAQLGGLSSGGGGAGAGAGGGGPALSARDPREAAGSTTVIIQTVNPFSKEVIGETSYQLNRAGVLKTPIYAPPTRGAYAG